MKPIELLVIRKRNALTKKSASLFRAAIRAQYNQAVDIIKTAPISSIIETLQGSIKSAPVEAAFVKTYTSAASIAMIWRKYLLKGKKAGEDDAYNSIFEKSMADYARIKAGRRIARITETTEDYILSSVRSSMTEAVAAGLGVTEMREQLLIDLAKSYTEMTSWRAQAIAQTEMTAAANEAAMEGASSTGFEIRKFWSTSGLERTRDSHLAAEAESIERGGLKEDETFSNGLLYPGDPSGEASEVVNCRCSILIEIV